MFSSVQPTKISEDEFTSGDKFVFTIDSPSPKGRVTRSRRSSICLNPPTKPTTKARRQIMLPAVKEMPKSPVKNGKSKVFGQLLKTPSKVLEMFTPHLLKLLSMLSWTRCPPSNLFQQPHLHLRCPFDLWVVFGYGRGLYGKSSSQESGTSYSFLGGHFQDTEDYF